MHLMKHFRFLDQWARPLHTLWSWRGQITKAVNQILVGINMLGVAEALMFASKAGVDLKRFIAAVAGGAAGSWQLTNNGAKLLEGDLEPGFKVKDYLKDLRIIMETSGDLKMPLIGTAIVQQMFRNLDAEGFYNKGTQAIIIAIEKLAGKKLLKYFEMVPPQELNLEPFGVCSRSDCLRPQGGDYSRVLCL